MTQIGIEYQKMKNQKDAFDETARANRQGENIKWANLEEDRRYHKDQVAHSKYATDTQAAINKYAAALNAATQRYSIAQNAINSKYASDNALRGTQYSADKNQETQKYVSNRNVLKDTVIGAYEGAKDATNSVIAGLANTLGFLWDTLI